MWEILEKAQICVGVSVAIDQIVIDKPNQDLSILVSQCAHVQEIYPFGRFEKHFEIS
jgi:hypothetical protein